MVLHKSAQMEKNVEKHFSAIGPTGFFRRARKHFNNLWDLPKRFMTISRFLLIRSKNLKQKFSAIVLYVALTTSMWSQTLWPVQFFDKCNYNFIPMKTLNATLRVSMPLIKPRLDVIISKKELMFPINSKFYVLQILCHVSQFFRCYFTTISHIQPHKKLSAKMSRKIKKFRKNWCRDWHSIALNVI